MLPGKMLKFESLKWLTMHANFEMSSFCECVFIWMGTLVNKVKSCPKVGALQHPCQCPPPPPPTHTHTHPLRGPCGRLQAAFYFRDLRNVFHHMIRKHAALQLWYLMHNQRWACDNRAVYTRENKPRIRQSAAYISRGLNHLYDHGLYKNLVRGLRGPRTSFLCRSDEQLAAYFPSYKRP